jgi:hypothetical protein
LLLRPPVEPPHPWPICASDCRRHFFASSVAIDLAGELEAAWPQADLAVTNTEEAPEAFWRWFGGKGPVKK